VQYVCVVAAVYNVYAQVHTDRSVFELR
jgi:hypothetical protein